MQQAEKEENTVLNKLNLNNAVTKEFNATVLMHIKKDNIKIQKCLHGITLLQVEIPWRYGARGKKNNNSHSEIIWIIIL